MCSKAEKSVCRHPENRTEPSSVVIRRPDQGEETHLLLSAGIDEKFDHRINQVTGALVSDGKSKQTASIDWELSE